MTNLEKEIQELRRENERLRADLKDAKERIEYLLQWRDAFSEDFLRGYKEQIEKKHGIYRCDMCKHTEGHDWLMAMNEKDPCPEDCDGYKHWKWRGFKYEPTEEE